MKWYTCIVHVEGHINPVQYFHTRADSPGDAEKHAEAWMADPQWEGRIDVEFVFEGRLEPEALPERTEA